MHLWTIQTRAVWDALRAQRTLYVPPRDWYPESYAWIIRQLQAQVPGYQGNLPWWAHCRKQNVGWHRDSYHYRRWFARIELDVPDDQVLSFPCWAWDRVYCRRYLAFTQAENSAWEAGVLAAGISENEDPLPEPWQSELEASWLRLFDPNLPPKTWNMECYRWPGITSREAVFEVLDLRHVRTVAVARGKSRFSWQL